MTDFLVTRFMEEISYVFLFIFLTAAHFHLGGRWHFLFFQPRQRNFQVVLPTIEMSPLYFISRSSCLSLFFSLSFAGLLPTFSFSPSLSVFHICGHDSLSKLNTSYLRRHRYRNKFRFLFSSLLTLQLFLLHKMRFPASDYHIF